MNFLEDPRGIEAKAIIAYGFSIGGGVISEGLKEHRFKEGIKICDCQRLNICVDQPIRLWSS